MPTTGQYLINSIIPKKFRDDNRSLSGDGMRDLMEELQGELSSEEYKNVLHKFYKLGADVSYNEGSSFTLEDLKTPLGVKLSRVKLEAGIQGILNTKASKQHKEQAIITLVADNMDKLTDDMYAEALGNNSGLANQVASKTRGKPADLRSLILGDLLMADGTGKPTPVPIMHGYSEGVDPAEYWSGVHGARQGLTSIQRSVAEAGFLCLEENTEVWTSHGTKKIKDLQQGDKVLGSDLLGNRKEVKVLHKFNSGEKLVNKYTFSDNDGVVGYIVCTKDHKVLTSEYNVAPIGDTKILSRSPMNACITSVKKVGTRNTYDIEVNHPDHLFVLANGITVSNSKKIKQVAHKQVVTTKDCGTQRGLEVDTKDRDNIGALLAEDVGDYKAGQPISATMLKRIPQETIQVRSPISCDAPDGVCAKCVGIRETGSLSKIGDNLGMPAAQSIAERVVQTALCLEEGTLVYINGVGNIKLRDIKVGQEVIAVDLLGNQYAAEVVHVHSNGLREVSKYTFSGGEEVVCTPDHKFLTSSKEILPIGGFKVLPSGEHERPGDTGVVKVDKLGLRNTLDIEIDTEDHLFILTNGLIVSNSAKHSAGRTSGKSSQFVDGFELIEQLMDVPKSFTDAATISSMDGQVDSITKAPQGGHFVYINNEEYHVPEKMKVTVKKGDTIEAGDLLSEGIPNPAELIKYKGIGETRRLYTNQLKQVTGANRRNLEILSKGFLDFVRVHEPDVIPNSAPDDVIKYSELLKTYQPRKGSTDHTPNMAKGQYLEKQYGHYTIGTKVTKSVINELGKRKVGKILTHKDKPAFEPVMVPSVRGLMNSNDWQERLGGYHLKDSLLGAAQKGMKSDIHGVSYLPGIMRSEDFGSELKTTGRY